MSPSVQDERFDLECISSEFTEETLRQILNTALDRNDCVLDRWIVAGGAGSKGDAYLSEVVRMKVYAKPNPGNKNKSSVDLLIKSLPSNIGRRKSFRSTDFFKNEITFYQHVVPAFEDLQKRKNVNYNLFARCFAYFCDGKGDFLVLEDLSPHGYASQVRQEGFNLLQCQAIIHALAQYHGLSYALKDQNPIVYKDISDKLEEMYFAERFRDWVRDFHKDQIACVLDALEKELPNTVYQKKMMEFTDKHYFDRMIAMAQTRNQYSVINHGDSWIPNFLMNYEEDKPKSVKIIDFQLARDASPILDLMLIFYAATTQKLRDSHFNDLLQYYYDTLCKTVEELGSNPAKMYPKAVFEDELKKFSKFGLGFSLEAVPFLIMKNEDTPDLDTIEGDEAVPITTLWKVRPITYKEGRQRLTDNVRHAVDNGYL